MAVAAAAIDLADGLSDFIWDQTRYDAIVAMDNLGVTLMAHMAGMHFVGVFVALALMAAMLFMWVTLFVRESLIYLVVIYAVSFGLPAMIFPPLRDTSKKVLELLVALIIAKPVMILALSVGISALGGVGATGGPGDAVGANLGRELGTLIAGVITFGLAAFMPFLVWKLMPIVAAAVVAQGSASAPMRGGTQAMQMQYYGQSTMRRLSGSSGGWAMAGSSTGAGSAGPVGGGAGPAGGGGVVAGLAGGGASTAATGGGIGSAAAAHAAGPLAPVVIAAGAAKAAASATKNAVTSTTESATGSSPSPGPSSNGRDIGGGR